MKSRSAWDPLWKRQQRARGPPKELEKQLQREAKLKWSGPAPAEHGGVALVTPIGAEAAQVILIFKPKMEPPGD